MRRETYPETKSGMLQTSRPGIPHRRRGWEGRARAAFAFARPSRECRRSQAAPSADQPGRESAWKRAGLRALDASTPPEREKRRAEKRGRRRSSSSRWVSGVGSKFPGWLLLLRDTSSHRVPPPLSPPQQSLLPSLLCCTKCWREGGGRRRGGGGGGGRIGG